LLVFRTNNAYQRLEEARELWGKVSYLTREIVSTVAAAWNPEGDHAHGDISSNPLEASIGTPVVASVCRYLAAFTWSLRDQLRDGDKRCDIMNILLRKKGRRLGLPLSALGHLRSTEG